MLRLSLRYQLALALIVLNVAGTAVIATVAYEASRSTLDEEALRAVGQVAASRERAVRGIVRSRQQRFDGFLSSLTSLCGERAPSGIVSFEHECVRVALTGFHRSERASATELRDRGRRLAVRGWWPRRPLSLEPDQVAEIQGVAGRGEYTMRAVRGSLVLQARFSLDELDTVFADRSGLTANGETFITNRAGYLLTSARYAAAASWPLPMPALDRCRAGVPDQLITSDYRSVPAIVALRPVRAIGGGCIVAVMPQQDALAPFQRLSSLYTYASATVILIGGLVSILIAGVATHPIKRLVKSANRFAEGELDEPFPVAGSSEVRHLGQTLTRMARSIGELVQREQKARKEAEAANRMKDDFLAILSHELRTPLSAIVGWASILERNQHDPTLVARAVGVINRNARTQSKMIEELLDVSRIVAGKERLTLTSIPVSAAVDNALEAIAPTASAKGVNLTKRIDIPERVLNVDAQRLQQILWNLLSNAVRFTPRGGLVEVAVRDVDGDTEIHVADTGSGISPAFLPHVFERFRQADSSTTRSHSGLGLGLAIVRDLVQLHGGTVRAESAGEGRGATFIVRLPGRPESVDTAETAGTALAAGRHRHRPQALALSGARVLVVDDDPDTREVLQRILEGAGAMVTTTGSAHETRDALKTAVPDLLIADIGMPEEDGYSLIRSIRRLERGPRRMPAIALTAHSAPQDVEYALASGFQLHVAKPIDSSRLVASVATLVESVH